MNAIGRDDYPKEKVYGWEKRGGKYYVYVTGVRVRVSKEQYDRRAI